MESLWTPLHSANSTRLLILEPGSGRDPIQATLEQINLADSHRFEAVSYHWGNDQRPMNVEIDRTTHLVRYNLWKCLTRLRHEDRQRKLWVDALCISQNDLEEKAQQIAIIDKIFRYARRVLAYVGESQDDSDMLFRPWPTSGYRHAWNQLRGRQTLSASEIEVRQWVWSHFIDRMYFRRTWIVQEIAVAEKVIIHCGRRSMNWAELIDTRFQPGVFDGLSRRDQPLNIDRLVLLQDLRSRQGVEIGTIFFLAHKFRDTLCADPRDKIYALLSMETRSQCSQPISANQTIELPELFVQVVSQRIHQLKPLTRTTGIICINDLVQALNLDRNQRCRAISILRETAVRDSKDARRVSHWLLLLDMMGAAMGKGGKKDPEFSLVGGELFINDQDSDAQKVAKRVWNLMLELKTTLFISCSTADLRRMLLVNDEFVYEYDEDDVVNET